MVPVLEKTGPGKKSNGTGPGKNWSQKKVPVPVPEKNGPGKKYRYRSRKKLVLKKVLEPAPEKMLPVPENFRELPVILCEYSDDIDPDDNDLYIIGRFCLSVCHEK